ncbi:transposase [Rapidithrix thailandica]|uniref:Transposase n=1 Tax=Rapidithrix thailandica TaxID=413964 RepID=A0AAW9SAF8_9BACT
MEKIAVNRNVEMHLSLSRADLWLFICLSTYFIMNGAQLWETVIMTPAWTAAPPASLVFFQAPYGLDFKVFWIVVHSCHEVIFLLALVFNWKIRARRLPLLILFVVHVAIRVWTLAYFVPTIIEFQHLPFSNAIDPELVVKAAQWRHLNYLRVGLFFIVNLLFIPVFSLQSTQQ